MPHEKDNDRLKQTKAELEAVMEQAGARIRTLVLAQPPAGLLGYLWSQFYMGVLAHQETHRDIEGPDQNILKRFQFVLEYIHAVWSSHKSAFAIRQVDEARAQELIAECDGNAIRHDK